MIKQTEPQAPRHAAQAGSRLQWGETLGLVAIYIILVGTLSAMSPYFLERRNLLNILVAVSTIGIVSVAMTMVIVTGGIDLSVGSVVALAGVAVAQLSHSMPIWWAVAAAVTIGLVVGAANGIAVTVVRINPLITTLGTLSIARGLAFVYSGGLTQTISNEQFAFLGRGFVFGSPEHGGWTGVPFVVVVMAVMFALTAWVMRSTVFGRSIYAVGGSAAASRLAGIPVNRVLLAVYTLCGVGAALGGIFQASQLGAGAPQAATGIELSVIAAVILGGTSLNGGKGTIFGTMLGVLIMGTLNNGLTLLGVNSYFQDVARGAVLLVAVGLDQLRLRLANRD